VCDLLSTQWYLVRYLIKGRVSRWTKNCATTSTHTQLHRCGRGITHCVRRRTKQFRREYIEYSCKIAKPIAGLRYITPPASFRHRRVGRIVPAESLSPPHTESEKMRRNAMHACMDFFLYKGSDWDNFLPRSGNRTGMEPILFLGKINYQRMCALREMWKLALSLSVECAPFFPR
jgi:hypothetical protein